MERVEARLSLCKSKPFADNSQAQFLAPLGERKTTSPTRKQTTGPGDMAELGNGAKAPSEREEVRNAIQCVGVQVLLMAQWRPFMTIPEEQIQQIRMFTALMRSFIPKSTAQAKNFGWDCGAGILDRLRIVNERRVRLISKHFRKGAMRILSERKDDYDMDLDSPATNVATNDGLSWNIFARFLSLRRKL
jgi:hypothetical protein